MDPFTGWLILIGAAAAITHAARHARGDYARGREKAVTGAEMKAGARPLAPPARRTVVRRHRAGWWGREFRHGFPVTRTGFHTGWLAHRAAEIQGRAIREEARTTHEEVRASFAAEIAAHRARQAAALAGYEAALAASAAPPDGSARSVRAALADVLPFRRPADPGGATARDPEPALRAGPGPYAPPRMPPSPPQPSPAEGASQQMATDTDTDTKYSVVMSRSRAFAQRADEQAAEASRRAVAAEMNAADAGASLGAAMADADAMQAAGVDGATLGAQLDLIETLRAQRDAAQAAMEAAGRERAAAMAVHEQAGAVAAGLSARHGGIDEAITNAPVRAARTGFYGEY